MRHRSICIFLAAFITSALTFAQGPSTGTITGTVADQQGASVAGASIVITDSVTSTQLKSTSNDTGRYIFPNVPPGSYDVQFEKTGFSQKKLIKQTVEVGQSLGLNVTLEVGATTSVVEVTSEAGAELQTLNATVGTTISGDSLILLPNLGRDASSLAIYQPGVSPEGATAGAMYDQNTFQLDGGNNSNDMDGTQNIYTAAYASNGAPSGSVPTPVESIEEFKVSTAGQTADFNGSSGSQVQMVTKRGQNSFHGAAYEYYFASDIGAANSWDNNHTPYGKLAYTPLPITHKNRFGYAVGGPMLPKFLGGKTYFFFNSEYLRYPQSAIVTKTVPTALLKAGIIQVKNSAGAEIAYNLNPITVTVNGTQYAPAQCGTTICDPRGIGLNADVALIWNKYMPAPNVPTGGDHFNTQAFQGVASLPYSSNFYVGRIDHDFGDKWRFMTSYRYFRSNTLTTNQVDIGGLLPGDTLGTPAARAPRPTEPTYWVFGLDGSISPSLTSSFHFSYLRNWWQWASSAAPTQIPGLGGALEIGGESANALIPYNVNTQNVRQRFWDGHDTQFKEDLSWFKGNHFIQYGGMFERNYDYHLRTDNGQGIMNQSVYQIGNNTGLAWPSSVIPSTVPTSQLSAYKTLYTEVLGIVDQSQDLFTRTGPQLTLNPPGSSMFDQSTINFYNGYVTDTWHVKPTLTLTYGLGYQVEMPPTEANGKQVELVDTSGHPIDVTSYLNQRQSTALAGGVYDPILGFATVKNVVGASHKYPYDPYYGGLSPRVSFAWNPKFNDGILGKLFGSGQTVIRGGYGRIDGRLNGVDLVLIPLLGTGLGQAVSCIGVTSAGTCPGNGGATAATAFRIGTDGNVAPLPAVSQTLPQPYFPGINGNAAAGSGSVLDPHFRPSTTDNFQFSIQREIKKNVIAEVGYIGRFITHEWQQVDISAIPYMTTLGGQSFAQAYSAIYPATVSGSTAVANQPFFESALGGSGSAFCSAYASCTQAILHNSTLTGDASTTSAGDFWNYMAKQNGWTLGRTTPASPSAAIPSGQMSGLFYDSSTGKANYNALYVSFTTKNYKGVTLHSNFTWGRALGTGNQSQATSSYTVVDPWHINQSMYGPQFFDYKAIYSLTMVWQDPYFRTQKGLIGHLLGGWTVAPIYTFHSGAPLAVGNDSNGSQSFGETTQGGTNDNAVLAGKFTGGNSALYNQTVTNADGVGVNSNVANGGQNLNMFSNPAAIYAEFRDCVLGFDTQCGSAGQIRGMSYWNLDATASKDIGIWKEGRVGATLLFQFTNLLNHVQQRDPYLCTCDPADFGVLGSNNPNGSGQVNTPRNMEFGLRVHF
jgi:hypothetical protein